MSKILVTPKVHPDLDGTSCALAYSELLQQEGKDAQGIITGNPQSEVCYFVEKEGIKIPTREDIESDSYGAFILVDASSMKGMPKTVRTEKVIEIVDHRQGEPEKLFPQAKVQNELIGAAATLIVERFLRADRRMNLDYAKLLYGAIFHNTLNFIATNTDKRDREASEYLQKEYKIDTRIPQNMFLYATEHILKNVKQAIVEDGKEFGEDFDVRAYQLVVWGNTIFEQKGEIQKVINELLQNTSSKFGFLNLVDVEEKVSHIYCESKIGQELLIAAVGGKFENGWNKLNQALLRKQIIPQIERLM